MQRGIPRKEEGQVHPQRLLALYLCVVGCDVLRDSWLPAHGRDAADRTAALEGGAASGPPRGDGRRCSHRAREQRHRQQRSLEGDGCASSGVRLLCRHRRSYPVAADPLAVRRMMSSDRRRGPGRSLPQQQQARRRRLRPTLFALSTEEPMIALSSLSPLCHLGLHQGRPLPRLLFFLLSLCEWECFTRSAC